MIFRFIRVELNNYGYGIIVGAESNANKQWISDPEFGSNKFVFIENNYFRETRHALTGSSNAKYVFRFNKVEDNWVTKAIDMHGAGDFNNVFSSRAAEIYNNNIVSKYDSYGNLINGGTPWYHYV